MDEIKTNEEDKKEESAKTEDDGVREDTIRTVDYINLASKRAEEAAEKLRIENDRKENNYAKMQRGGFSEAGGTPVKPVGISDEEYARKAMAGEFNIKK